jgi:anti-sigma regulatory factor (Ser/Thr protein kinase)
VVPTVELLVSELVTNAVMHTTGPISIRLLLQTDIRCEVIDSSRTLPVRAEADLLDEQGRGLLLVDELARRWGTQTRPGGKLVWFEHPCAAS